MAEIERNAISDAGYRGIRLRTSNPLGTALYQSTLLISKRALWLPSTKLPFVLRYKNWLEAVVSQKNN